MLSFSVSLPGRRVLFLYSRMRFSRLIVECESGSQREPLTPAILVAP